MFMNIHEWSCFGRCCLYSSHSLGKVPGINFNDQVRWQALHSLRSGLSFCWDQIIQTWSAKGRWWGMGMAPSVIYEILEKVGLLMTADPWLPGYTCRAAPLPNSSPTLALDASLGQHLEPADRSERWSGLQLTSTNWPQLKLLRCFRLRSQTLTNLSAFSKALGFQLSGVVLSVLLSGTPWLSDLLLGPTLLVLKLWETMGNLYIHAWTIMFPMDMTIFSHGRTRIPHFQDQFTSIYPLSNGWTGVPPNLGRKPLERPLPPLPLPCAWKRKVKSP